ncbi:MAG: FHA domain-containing protein [Thermoleophilia bacterium]|nr:FHA domain-containing protein [Thermoleophilia bacterium]
MGLLRRVEFRLQRGVEGAFDRAFKSHIQPVELAAKLVKEMEDHKTRSASRTYVPNQYTIFLGSADRDEYRPYEGALVSELASHLLQHSRRQGYDMTGPPRVLFTSDADLKPGQFGILAESTRSALPPSPAAAKERLPGVVPAGPPPTDPMCRAPVVQETQSITPRQATALGLARQTLVLRHGPHAQEFQHGRVVLGRGREADFRLDDPNVSRRHAVLYWQGGQMFIKDLSSTNGTFVNGRPVTSGPVVDGDVLSLGGCDVVVGTA